MSRGEWVDMVVCAIHTPFVPGKMTLGVLAFVGASAVAASTHVMPAEAFECTRAKDATFVSIYWEQRIGIRYAIRSIQPKSIDSATALGLVQAGFRAWEEPRCSDLSFAPQGVVEPGVPIAEVSQVVFVQDSWTSGGRAYDAVALTTMHYSVTDGSIKYGVMELNEDLYKFTDAVPECTEAGEYDLGAVVTHEAGHFIGLAHNETGELYAGRPPTMAKTMAPCDTTFRALSTDDIEGLCTIYPTGQSEAQQCATLPPQDTPYVQGIPFGCRANRTHIRPAGSVQVVAIALLLVVAFGRSRWR